MPTALRIKGLKFFFYSNEKGEPEHIHVRSQGKTAKFWLVDISIAENKGFAQHELTDIARHIAAYRNRLMQSWKDHFGV